MGGGIRGGVQLTLHLVAVEVNDYHILRTELVIVHSGRLDNEQAGFPVDPGDIAPGKHYQPVGRKLQIGFPYLFLKFFQHNISSLYNYR